MARRVLALLSGRWLSWDFEVRFSGDAGSTVAAVRQAIREIDPRLPVSSVGTLAGQVDHSVVDQRLTAQLSSFFSLVAVFLACIGIYGLMSYDVLHRTNEIGIRVALGAQQSQVLTLILRQGLVLAIAGVAIGTAMALGLNPLSVQPAIRRPTLRSCNFR